MASKILAFSLVGAAAALLGSAQAAVMTLDFETIGRAAPGTGRAVGDQFKPSFGLTFSGNALAFHKGVTETPNNNDTNSGIVPRAGNPSYVRSPFSASLPLGGMGFGSFTIDIAAGMHYDKFELTLGVGPTEVQIYAYGAGDIPLNVAGIYSFQSPGSFLWKAPYLLVDGSAHTNIARITFNVASRGLFAIDDLKFTEAFPAGGNVPEPAGFGLVALALAAAGAASRRSKSA